MVKFGIIGPGHIAQKFADAVNLCPQAQLYAVASRTADSAEQFATTYNAVTWYDSYDALLADEQVDVVYIALPNHLHGEMTKRCAKAGKAIICEKPFVTTEQEAKEVLDCVKQQDVLFMEAMWNRFLPTYQQAHAWIDQGMIGTLSLMQLSFGFCAPVNPDSRLFNKEMFGGGLWDVGCYTISAALDFAGEYPNAVVGGCRFGQTGVDEVGAATLQFPSGLLAQLSFGIRVKTDHDAVLYGAEGKIVLEKFWGCQQAVCYNQAGEEVARCTDDQNGFYYEVEEMCRLFLAGAKHSDHVTWQDSLQYAKIFDQLHRPL